MGMFRGYLSLAKGKCVNPSPGVSKTQLDMLFFNS